MNYSYLVMIIAFAALVAADEDAQPKVSKEDFDKVHEDCKNEAGLTTEQNEKALRIEYPDEKEVREYLVCCMKKIEVFNEDTGFDIDRLMKHYTAMFGDVEAERDAVSKCLDSNEQKTTTGEWVYRMLKCIMDTKIGDHLTKSHYNRANTFARFG